MKRKLIILGLIFILFKNLIFINKVSASDVFNMTNADTTILPDKYNTGCFGELEKIELDIENGNIVDDILFVQGSNATKFVLDFYYRNKEKSGELIIKNKDFSSLGVVCYHEDMVDREIEVKFINCKFSSMSTGKNKSKISYEFINCSFNSFYGSNSILDKCQFGENFTDGIVPFINVTVKNSYFKDFAGVITDKGAHTDGTQLYGHKDLDVENILYENNRFEIPPVHKAESAAYINACIMLQIEYSNGKNILFKNNYVNGGGYSVYTTSKKEEFTFTNTKIDGLIFGCASKYGIFYPKIHSNVEFSNISQADSLFVGSVWKDNGNTHFSVTNDTSINRDLLICTNKGIFEYQIPACLQIGDITDDTLFSDFPFDIDICINEDVDYAVCYDVTKECNPKQIRFVNYTNNDVYLNDEIKNKISYSNDDILIKGDCGKNVAFTLTKGGVLTLSGSGATDNFHSAKSPEWVEYKDLIKEVIVNEGITSLGSMIFRHCKGIEKITLPESLTGISQYALGGCVSLDNLTLPKNIAEIGKNVVSGTVLGYVYYEGDNWDNVNLADGNDNLSAKLTVQDPNKKEEEIIPNPDILPEDNINEENDNNEDIVEKYNEINIKDIVLISGLSLIILVFIIVVIIIIRRKK